MKWLVVELASGDIVHKYENDSSAPTLFIGSWENGSTWKHVELPAELDMDCVQAVVEVDGSVTISEDEAAAAAKLADEREAKLDELRAARAPKLTLCDQLVNVAFLNNWDSTQKDALKDYRQALLDATEPFKADMSLVDALVVSEYEWPEEPA